MLVTRGRVGPMAGLRSARALRLGFRGSATVLSLVIALTGCADSAGEADESVTVLAASSLTEAFTTLAAAFEQANPRVDISLSFGGSAGLAEQITAGAPADVFAAADDVTMGTVIDAGLAARPVHFARNTLQIVTPRGNPAGVTALVDFADESLLIALCEPRVPCGAAAEAVFATAEITPAPDTLEQDVRAVLTKVELGEVDAGLVYRTDVLVAGDAVTGVDFAEAEAAANYYPIVALTGAGGASAAFVAFVRSVEGQRILGEAGFGAP